MKLRKGSPGKGDTPPRPEHFAYTPTPPGSKPWAGWCANEPYWCLGHPDYETGTKPCLDWLTSGALQCPRCRPGQAIPWIGYLGLWREEDLTARMIVLREQNSELAETLQYGDYVIVSRAAGEGNPVAVKRPKEKREWKSRKYQRQSPADYTHSLLTMWSLPLLSRWYEDQFSVSDNEVSMNRRVYVKDDGTPYTPEMQSAARRAGAQYTTDSVTIALYEKMLRRLTGGIGTGGVADAPSSNGHAKKKTD